MDPFARKPPVDFTFGPKLLLVNCCENYQPSIANRYPVLDQKRCSSYWGWRCPILRRYLGDDVRIALRNFRTATRPVTRRRLVIRVGISGRVRTAPSADSSARATRELAKRVAQTVLDRAKRGWPTACNCDSRQFARGPHGRAGRKNRDRRKSTEPNQKPFPAGDQIGRRTTRLGIESFACDLVSRPGAIAPRLQFKLPGRKRYGEIDMLRSPP